ncbi:hypothetical protein FOCC_FOCC000305 [Frankliniella occidentalis]|nr:hypothetical protein FOCC_FOCC000305 [Frankliniella occidentalis]
MGTDGVQQEIEEQRQEEEQRMEEQRQQQQQHELTTVGWVAQRSSRAAPARQGVGPGLGRNESGEWVPNALLAQGRRPGRGGPAGDGRDKRSRCSVEDAADPHRPRCHR